jgi:hypothetical protein
MLGLVIVHDQTGVNDAGDPAEESQDEAQKKARDAAGHQDGYRRKNDAKKVAQSLQNQTSEVSGRRSEINVARRCG